MKRVLQVIGGMNRAGAETMLMNIYRTIDHTQIQFDFVVYREERQDYEAEIETLGGRIFRITTKNPFKMMMNIRKILNAEGPYIAIHAHTLLNIAFAMLAALGTNVVRVAHSHSTRSSVDENLFYCIYKFFSKGIIRIFSQRWLACGESAGEYLFGKAFRTKGIIIYNSVDPQKFSDYDKIKTEDIKSHYELKDKLVIGSIARLEAVKNHAFQIEIAKAMKERSIPLKMLFIGRGPLENELRQLVIDMGLESDVLFLGVRSDIPELLQVIDVFLMPSYFEGNPVTLVEAQAAGVPCVIADHITDEIDLHINLCFRCSLNDDLKSWVDTCLEAKKCREKNFVKIKNALRERNYDLSTNVERLLKVYGH